MPTLTTCVNVSIDREKHSKERGWNGGLSQTADRWESNLTAADPVTGEIKKIVQLRYPNYAGTLRRPSCEGLSFPLPAPLIGRLLLLACGS